MYPWQTVINPERLEQIDLGQRRTLPDPGMSSAAADRAAIFKLFLRPASGQDHSGVHCAKHGSRRGLGAAPTPLRQDIRAIV